MENQALKRINNFLIQNGASVDTISKSRLTQFLKVDNAIQGRLKKINEAEEILKSNTVNISLISSDTDIARKTFYNNELLRLYVEKHSGLLEDKTVPESELERYKGQCEDQKQQIQQFLLRDIETENLRNENIKLHKEIQNLETRNASLEEHNEKFQTQISDINKKQSNEKCVVLKFKQNIN